MVHMMRGGKVVCGGLSWDPAIAVGTTAHEKYVTCPKCKDKPCITSATQPHDVTCWRCAPEAK